MKYVAYYRVSTVKQGQSGLGLEAQQAAARQFAPQGIVSEYTEIESGKKDARPMLHAAITEAKAAGAVLLIAKLDRLSRNAAFIFTLKESGVKFVCADMPDANTLTVGLFAVIAEHERETIAKRTKDALAAKRARGEQLGNVANLTAAGRAAGVAAIKANAANAKENVQARQIVEFMSAAGATLTEIADNLNAKGYRTRRGCLYAPMTVKRLKEGTK